MDWIVYVMTAVFVFGGLPVVALAVRDIERLNAQKRYIEQVEPKMAIALVVAGAAGFSIWSFFLLMAPFNHPHY